jgi:uncharacterized repeat protein (TIGR03803 family)
MRSAYVGLFVAGCVAVAGCSSAGSLVPGAGGLAPDSRGSHATIAHGTSSSDPTLYLFKGAPDGSEPYGGLIDVGGTLYGTTWIGGTSSEGTVFSITPGGSETVLHSFTGSPDGQAPFDSLVYAKGKLYGTTEDGGTDNIGSVFSITTAGKEKVLYSFPTGTGDSAPYGQGPLGALLYYKGALYGTTLSGGAEGYGVVFKLTLGGTLTVLHSFEPGDTLGEGAYPKAGLVAYKGALYGTTSQSSGSTGCGIVFSVTPAGTGYTIVHGFAGGTNDGCESESPLLVYKGKLYGLTQKGGKDDDGTVFEVATAASSKVRILHSFGTIADDGYGPIYGGLTNVNGTFYGTTYYSVGGAGSVFSVTPSGTYAQLINFVAPPNTPNYPNNPAGSVIDVNGVLYGTSTSNQGADTGNGAGTVFTLPV